MIFIKIPKIIIQVKNEILIVLNDMIADIRSNKKLYRIVTELFIRGRKLNIISLVFITQSYFAVPKYIRLNSTHYFLLKILNKRELIKLHVIILQILTFKTL